MSKFSKDRVKQFLASALGFLAEGLVFFLLAIAATRPLAYSWKVAIPQGTETVATVPLFNLWTLGWNIDRAEAGFGDYWDAPIFFPAEDAFAFSEPQPILILMAPVIWCGGSLAMAYNLSLWLGLALSGVVTSRLVFALSSSWFAAWTGGAMMTMLPYVHWQLGVLQLVPMFGVVWTIFALWKFGGSPTIIRGLLLGTAFATTYFLCNYYGLFLNVLLVLSGFCLLGRPFWNLAGWKDLWFNSRRKAILLPIVIVNGKAWLKLLPGAVWCLLLIGPMILHQRHISKQHDWTRPAELIQRQSAKWGDFTATPWPQLLTIRQFVSPERPGWTLSPGYLKFGLALVGLAWGLRVARLRRMTIFLALFVALSLLLAMGPNFHVGSWVPYDWLREHYPGLKMARNVFRFVVFFQVGIVLLAALGLDGLWTLVQSLRTASNGSESASAMPESSRFPAAHIAMLGLGFLAIIEVWPAPQKLFHPPDIEREREWLTWIEENTKPEDPLACIPFANGIDAGDYFGTTVWMYYGLEHGRPIVNGYSGYFPEPALVLKESMANFPDVQSLKLLEENGVKYCVVFQGAIERSAIENHPLASQKLQWRFTDFLAEIDIYEFVPVPR